MSASYQAVLFNRQKKIYDTVIAGSIVIYLVSYFLVSLTIDPQVTQETLIIRSTATLAILLLHIILAIGPLARLFPVFLPLLYNRRHLGVTMFFIAAVHGLFSIIQFHSLGNINPLLSVFQSNTHYESFSKFPFEIFGFVSLVILFLMAITSHDFWLHNLGPKIWKTLHMMVYLAYALIILHVMLGVIQYETSAVLTIMLGIGMLFIVSLHIAASHREYKIDSLALNVADDYIKVCNVYDIPDDRARVVSVGRERIAIFRYSGKISAVSNVCKHQHGPLGEGKIIDGCVTCPWHGYQYFPHNGTSPPPFTEKVATYDVKVIQEEVWVNPTPYPEGMERTPAVINTLRVQ